MFTIEEVPIDSIHPHPRNYKSHPPEQVRQIAASIREHGVYRPVVVARDGTLLAGHGVVEACRELGLTTVPVTRLDIAPDSTQAIKIIVADNELERMGITDDAVLASLLSEVYDTDTLLGTGFDDAGLASILALSQPTVEELTGLTAQQTEWNDMPEYVNTDRSAYRSIIMHFANAEDVVAFTTLIEQEVSDRTKFLWFPPQELDHTSDVTYEAGERVDE